MKLRQTMGSLLLAVSFAAFFVLSLPTKVADAAISAAAFLALYIALMLSFRGKEGQSVFARRLPPDFSGILACVLFEVLHLIAFHNCWMGSSKFERLTAALRLDSDVFLWILGGLCVLLSVGGMYFVLFCALREKRRAVCLVLVLLLAIWQFQLLLYQPVFVGRLHAVLINLLILYGIYLLFYLVLRKRRRALLGVSIFSTVLCVVNHYVILFHGSPFFPEEFANIPTAISVLPGYRLTVDGTIVWIAVLFAAQLALLFWQPRGTDVPAEPPFRFKRQLALLLAAVAVLYLTVFSPISLDSEGINRKMWSWQRAITGYGYYWCSLNDLRNVLHPIDEPDGYDAEALDAAALEAETPVTRLTPDEARPDIILILNETFCDLGEYCILDTDHDYMEGFYGIPGAAYGHAVVPFVGGGTNNSEMELLTANSMYLLKANAPFSYLNLEGMDSSAVTCLEALGYESTAMHCMNASNYSRNRAYPELGFDHLVLGEGNYTQNYYGNRYFLDEDNYQDMLALYEQAGERPQFYYLLTYQNHGGYLRNDASLDTVHTSRYYGRLTGEINEFLTSISMSSQAFRELTERLAQQSRPVIVCMVGDHAPSLISEIDPGMVCSKQDPEIAQRTVPFVMWSNYGLEFPADLDYASMTDLMPLLMNAAGLPLTPYYSYILSLHEALPVRTANGLYMDRYGTVGAYVPDYPYYDLITRYYWMEYNVLDRGDDYKKELFTLK